VSNALDFLLVLDSHTRESSLGYVSAGHQMQLLALEARLVGPDDRWTVARWTGELIHHRYVEHGPQHLGDRVPLPPGTAWSETEIQRVSDFRVTPLGREQADRMRHQGREGITDATLGGTVPHLLQPWMDDAQRRAISAPVMGLRLALDEERHAAAVGAAKDLVEAACKMTLDCRGLASREQRPSLPTLFKEAHRATESDDTEKGAAIGPSLAATVDRLAQLRNAAGAGHGRASSPALTARHARLAASAAIGIAMFLLGSEP
jgi:hypothetical protein